MQVLAGGGTAVMVNLTFNSPGLVEHLAALGFDAVMLDCEHTSASVERIEELARAARAAGIAAVVRPEKFDEAIVTRYLDCKVAGIMVPHVDDAATARRVVDVVRYALPDRWQAIAIIVMLESTTAVANLDEILAVEGITAFFIARVDLSKSMGLGGDKRHPEVVATVRRSIARIRAAGRHAGAGGDFDNVSDVVAQGARLVFVGSKGLLEPGAKAYLDLVSRASK
jgi:2-keto-3-deoxy-L-rhamnonate aldolase RhmA